MKPRKPTSHPHARHSARTLAWLLLAAAVALTGCSGADDGRGASASVDKAAVAPDGAAQEGAAQDGTEAQEGPEGSAATGGARQGIASPKLSTTRVIRSASLTVQVKNVSKALGRARTTVEDAGGYVSEENTTRDDEGREETRVVLRVPVERYDAVLTGLQGAGRLVDRSAKAQDVTDQVVDVDSRVKSARASVARVRELMDRATRLSDVVELEGELSRRQADLESLLARQAALKDRTSLAAITLSLSEKPADASGKGGDGPGFLDALAGGWHMFVTALRWLVAVIGAVLPFAAALALLALAWRRLVRPRLPRHREPAPAAPAAAVTTAPGPLPSAPPVSREPDRQD
ncbi:DUF4349 domain-containing protein [Streptomyces sp. MUM 2J]|uniref:DUF4349 domain-containing protein n=1 Tax=Streptomyces sp. MUM 2J TaxID=2791987 RepID=UPI001F0383EB|nr:DUF4349 domain-containing protein [Streptomyces sp. MUM 2J]MCH0561675.1 DUF4349 domain-containing protein [Streptomyces sp. MUM 2J]